MCLRTGSAARESHAADSATERGRAAPRLLPRGQGGFTIIELIIWIGVAISVMIAATASYVGTTRSWDGTARLTRVQTEGSMAVEMIGYGVRRGSSVTVGAGADSLNVFYWTGSTDSLTARYHFDGQQRRIEDINGYEVAASVDSVRFTSADGKVVNIDVFLRDDRGTLNESGDDLPVSISSTVVCRN